MGVNFIEERDEKDVGKQVRADAMLYLPEFRSHCTLFDRHAKHVTP
jgi:hypothetical protein